ncbi:MAG TPA: SxtJ family membrane protein [Vicinamibacterales bacterium]|nr:SxtJ family membrane protein [Vicinamibacterales bacterium]
MPRAVKPGAGGRSFGLAFGGLFVVVALWRAWRGRTDSATAFAVAAGVMLVLAFAAPTVLEAPNRVWMRFARALGWINSRILLSILFYVVISPYGALQRLLGRDRLGQRWRAAKPAWTPAPERLRDQKHYEHMY